MIAATHRKQVGGKAQPEDKEFSTGFYFIIIVFIAAICRMVYFYQFKNNDPAYGLLIHDSALFDELARRVASNGPVLEQPFYISPLYIYFLASLYKIFGHSVDLVRFVQFGLGTGTAIMTFFLARKFLGRTVGVLAGVMAAVYAPFLFFEENLLGTPVVTFLLMASMCCLVFFRDGIPGYLLVTLSGLLLSLAITGRPNLLLLVPAPILYILLEKERPGHHRIITTLFLVTGLVIPILLTGLHNQKASGEFTLLTTHGGINFYIGNHEHASGVWEAPKGLEPSVSAINLTESREYAEQATGRQLTNAQVSRFWYGKALAFILDHPFQWLQLTGKKFLLFWAGYEVPLNFDYNFHRQYASLLKMPLFNLAIYLPLAIFGLIVLARDWRRYWLLYAVIGLACVSIILFFMADRYRVVIMPFLIIMAAAGLVRLVQLFLEKSRYRWVLAGLLGVLTVVEIGYTQWRGASSDFSNDYYNISLAHLINENYAAAVTWGTRAIQSNPLAKNAYYNLGVAYLKLEERDKALAAFSAVVRIDSTDAGAHRNLGGLLLMAGDYLRAHRHLMQSLRYEPDNVATLMNLGLTYFYTGNYESAIDTWWRILQIDPENQQAQRNIQAAQASLGQFYLPGS